MVKGKHTEEFADIILVEGTHSEVISLRLSAIQDCSQSGCKQKMDTDDTKIGRMVNNDGDRAVM